MIGLILEGGGMRAGFVAGALMALMEATAAERS
jgi:predicted patatin/cPLA2 family phospholipase